jgi:hypothetical protein
MLPLVHAEDESLSEGDESDDVDLTDGSSHDSDGSEWDEGIFFANAVSTTTSLDILKVPPQLLSTLSRRITRRYLDITAFHSAGHLYGLVTQLLPLV